MKREDALSLVHAHLKNRNLVKHCLAVEACMRALAVKLGRDPEPEEIALEMGTTTAKVHEIVKSHLVEGKPVTEYLIKSA